MNKMINIIKNLENMLSFQGIKFLNIDMTPSTAIIKVSYPKTYKTGICAENTINGFEYVGMLNNMLKRNLKVLKGIELVPEEKRDEEFKFRSVIPYKHYPYSFNVLDPNDINKIFDQSETTSSIIERAESLSIMDAMEPIKVPRYIN